MTGCVFLRQVAKAAAQIGRYLSHFHAVEIAGVASTKIRRESVDLPRKWEIEDWKNVVAKAESS